MRITAEMRVLLFLSLVAGVYVLAASVLLRKVLERIGRATPPEGKWHIRGRRVILSLAAVGVLCGLYGYFVEPYWPQVTRTQLRSHKLAGAQRPVRLVHISDVHSDPKARLEARLPDIIAAENPDLIVFSGDSLNSPGGLANFRNCLARLAKIAPTHVVRGNWDTNYWRNLDLFGGTVAELSVV
jgi:predicted MPP superfamily phosphohydrolase